MIPYSREETGRVYFTDPSGVTDSGIAVPADLTALAVIRQELHGNHIDPNTFAYQKDEIFVNPFELSLIDSTFGTQKFHGRCRAGVTSGTSGTVDTLPSFPGVINPDAYDKAYAKLVSQIHEGSSQLIVDAAEWPETKAMVTGSGALHKRVASTFETLHDYARRSHLRDERLIAKLRDQWLELRYGWNPFVSSVYDAVDNLHRRVVNEVVPIKVRAAVVDRWELNDTVVKWYSSAGPLSVPRYRRWEDSHRCEICVNMQVPGTGIWDWTSLNPATIAWELLPMSFVADWFVTIGQSLENLETYFMWKCGFRSGYITYSYRGYRFGRFGGTASSGNYAVKSSAQECRIRTALDRQVLGSFPTPNPPRLRLSLNRNRVIDAAALTHTLVSSKMRAFNKLANKAVRF